MCKHGDTLKFTVWPGGQMNIVDVDRCIVKVVSALNKAGADTVASCCGHGKIPGNIALADGRELLICPDYETARKVEKMIGIDIHGAPLPEEIEDVIQDLNEIHRESLEAIESRIPDDTAGGIQYPEIDENKINGPGAAR